MSLSERQYQRVMLKQIYNRLQEAALDPNELKSFAQQLNKWFAGVRAPAAQVAAARVEDACGARVDPTVLAPRVWALEHEVSRLLRSMTWQKL